MVNRFGQDNFIANAMGIPAHSKILLAYDANDNIENVVYVNGTNSDESDRIVAVLALTYDLSNRLASVERVA